MSLYTLNNNGEDIFNQNTINTIEESNLFFSKVEYFNDPYELRPQFDFSFTDEEFLHKQKLIHIQKMTNKTEKEIDEDLSSIVENKIHRNPHYWQPFITQLTQTIRDEVGILCLTTDPANILMWAHYAQQNRGICLGFSWSNVTEFFGEAQEIQYVDTLPKINMFSLDINKQVDQMFFTKHNHWAYEKEWRIIEENGPGRKKYPQELLKEIIFGLNVPDKDKERIINLTKKHNKDIKFFTCYANPNDYQFSLHELET
jgi:hypothetical protein